MKFGKELAVAAPMTAKAAKDTAIAGTRLEATCRAASGCLISLRVLIRRFSHLRSLRVSPVATFSPLPISKTKKGLSRERS